MLLFHGILKVLNIEETIDDEIKQWDVSAVSRDLHLLELMPQGRPPPKKPPQNFKEEENS